MISVITKIVFFLIFIQLTGSLPVTIYFIPLEYITLGLSFTFNVLDLDAHRYTCVKF